MYYHKSFLTTKMLTIVFNEYFFDNKNNLRKTAEGCKGSWKKFQQEVMQILNNQQLVTNLDEIKMLTEKFYSEDEIKKISGIKRNISFFYIELLRKISKFFLTHRNGQVAVKYWESEGEDEFLGPYKGINKIILWNYLNRIFTSDLLVVKYLLDNNMKQEYYLNGFYNNIMLEDSQLQQILSEGIAETHIHMSAGINFTISWTNLMNISRNKLEFYNNEMILYNISEKSDELKNIIISLGSVRLFLTCYLLIGGNDLKQFFKKLTKKNIIYNKNLKKFETVDVISEKEKKVYHHIFDIMMNLYNKKDTHNNNYTLYDELKQTMEISNSDGNIDILQSIFNEENNIDTYPETIFIFKSMRYIEKFKDDKFFSEVFWQYIRIKNEVFKLKVQSNLIKGLDNFQKYFSRSTAYNYRKSNELKWEIILKTQLQNRYLKKLELRIALNLESEPDLKKELKDNLTSFFRAYKNIIEKKLREINEKNNGLGETTSYYYSNIPLIGIVFHLLKKKDNIHKCWDEYENNDSSKLYYKTLQDNYLRQVKIINYFREKIPALSEYIVGLDAASLENNTEPWVFSYVYNIARDSNNHKLMYSNKTIRIKDLGFTFHVGEDFRHIITGLRRIDEVIENCKFHSGDRIGHGIALGIDIEKWCKNHKVITLPRIEYIENLLWIWGLFKEGNYVSNFDLGYLEFEIMKHAEKIYEKLEGINLLKLWKAYVSKFNKINDDFSGDKCECNCKSPKNIIWNEKKLYYCYHCNYYLKKMNKPIDVEIKSFDIKLIKNIQDILRKKIANRGIIIEANPSSNSIIGEIDSIFEHHICNLNNKVFDGNNKDDIIVTINSDDPSVFNTNIVTTQAFPIGNACDNINYGRRPHV